MRCLLISFGLVFSALTAQAATLTIYTDRPTARIQPVADQLSAQTGAQVVIVEKSYNDIIAQLEAEGPNTPADLVFTKDIVFLSDLNNRSLLQPLTTTVKSRVAPALKASDDTWVAVTYRARTIVYDSTRVTPAELSTYEDLADPKWAGRLCMRTSRGTYNVSLIASFVAHKGEVAAKETISGILDNLAAEVLPNDIAMMNAMANGVCDVGIANTYYLGQVLKDNPNFPVKPFFANQADRGTHINGSGIGVLKTSKNAALAEQFIGLMLEEKNQLSMSADHMDYPAATGVLPNTLIKDWGLFKIDQMNWTEIGKQVPAALQIIKDLDYK